MAQRDRYRFDPAAGEQRHHRPCHPRHVALGERLPMRVPETIV
jgi:hypothetical protein